jgi:hypothetical protein
MRAVTRMTEHVQAYLSLRRAFGFHLSIAGQVLQSFARFADREAPGKPFSVELALRWAQSSPTGKQVSAARRLLILQPFARYLRTVEPVTEVLPKRLLGPAQYRYIPHVYTDVEIQALLEEAASLSSPGGLRARTVQTYLGLATCGARHRRLSSYAMTAPRLLIGKHCGPFKACAGSWAGSKSRALNFLACTISATLSFVNAFWNGTETESTSMWCCLRYPLIWGMSRSQTPIGT